MRSKRLELLEALNNQRPSTLTKQQGLKKLKRSITKPRSASDQREKQVVTDAVGEGISGTILEKRRSSTKKLYVGVVDDPRTDEIVTDAVGEILNVDVLENQRSSATIPCSVNGSSTNEILTDAVGETLNAVATEKQESSATKQVVTDAAVGERLNAVAPENQKSLTKTRRITFVSGRRKLVTDAVDEGLNDVALEKQSSSTTKPHISLINSPRRNEIATDTVDERLNTVAPEKPSFSTRIVTGQRAYATVKGQRAKEIVTDASVDERSNDVAFQKQNLSTTKPRMSFVTDAVDEILNAVALEKKRSSATKPCSATANGSCANEIPSIAVDARFKDNAIEKQRASTTPPCSAFFSGSRANKILSDPVDERLKAVDDMLDAGRDTGDSDSLDTWSDIRDEDADILDADGSSDDQSLPTNYDEDADALETRDEDAELLGSDENSDVQMVEDRSLPTNSEEVAGSSRKRKRDMVQTQVTDTHIESNNTNCPGNGHGSTSWLSDTRKIIKFDMYGRPCGEGSEQFATAIGKAVRAHCCPAIESWTKVPNSTKDNIWKALVAKYAVPEVYRPNVLARANHSYKNWKSRLRGEMDKYETISERKLNMPKRHISKREDWESFVDFCNTDEDRKRRADGKKRREASEFMQSCGRKGIYRKIYDLQKESPTGEVNRSAIFLDTHISKTVNDPESSSLSDIKLRLIKELVEANPDAQKSIDSDAVTLVCGRDSRGFVRGMGGGVSRTKVLASATVVETLREAQQENKRLQSDNRILVAKLGENTQNHASRPSNQSSSQAPGASHLAPQASNLPANSRLAPPASNLAGSSCFIKNFKGKTIALGSFNTADPPMEHVYSLIIENIFDRDAELFDKDGKLGDIMIGGVINWPKACVESNLPANSCYIRNFKRRTIGFGTFSASADPQMEHVYSVVVKEIYDRDAELFDTDGKLGDVMIGGVINWPKACIKPC